jgi:leader peptidase (prepilin peptidase)/N-methyltransferase
LVEALTGGLFVLSVALIGLEPELVLVLLFLAAMVAITFIDIDHFIIPDRIVIPGTVVGFIMSTALSPGRWWEFLLAGLAAAGFLFILGLLWPGGMGFGDVKLGFMMGVVLGRYVVVAIFLGFLVGGVVGLVLLATGIKKRRDKIPFGPYLALGSAIGLLLGEYILDAYLSLY